jgi:hypothetical protein
MENNKDNKDNINKMLNARNNNALTNTEFWGNKQSMEPTLYTYILMFDDCSPLGEDPAFVPAWNFIKEVAFTGHTLGRGLAGSIFFTSDWDIEKLATVFNTMKMGFVLFCVNNHSSVVRVNKKQQSDIYNFFKMLCEAIPVK